MEAATECIPIKPRAKSRVPWKTLAVMKIAFLTNIRNPTNANAQKLKKAQRELTHTKQSKNNRFKVRSMN